MPLYGDYVHTVDIYAYFIHTYVYIRVFTYIQREKPTSSLQRGEHIFACDYTDLLFIYVCISPGKGYCAARDTSLCAWPKRTSIDLVRTP
jgi:hypothetical protein